MTYELISHVYIIVSLSIGDKWVEFTQNLKYEFGLKFNTKKENIQFN